MQAIIDPTLYAANVGSAVDFSACKLPSIKLNAKGVMGREHPTVPWLGIPKRPSLENHETT
jgi:hypothetical protein